MKRIITIMIVANSIYANQNKIGTLFIGSQTLINNNYYVGCTWNETECLVQKTGINFGFLLPVKLTRLNIDYKVKIAFHPIEGYKSQYKSALNYCSYKYDKFSSGLNEILIGKSIQINNKSMITPQLGFGFIVETIWSDRNNGRIYSLFFYDYSIQYKFDMGRYSLGFIVNFENGFYPGYSEFEPLNRFNISFLISK